MVKVYGPAMSLDASGTLAGTMVYSRWKGRNYVRQRVIPANPKSAPQVGIRAMFRWLSQSWDALSTADKAEWIDRAAITNISPFNAFMSYNQKRWRNFQWPSKVDPATEVGTQPSANVWTATGGVRQITLTIRCDAPNDGWGFMFFRGATGFSTAFSNAIGAISHVPAGVEQTLVDSPLDPATYYYNLRTFTDDGVAAAEAGERTAVAT